MGAQFLSGSNITIGDGLQIQNFNGHALAFWGDTDVNVGAFIGSGLAGGIWVRGGSRLKFVKPTLRDPGPSNSNFLIGYYLDSTDGHTYGYATDVQFIGATIKGYENAQNFQVHAGERVSFVGTEEYDALDGVNVGPFVPSGGAYTTTAANFTQPAVGASVIVQVASNATITLNQWVFVPTGGLYQVTNINVDGIHITLKNLGNPLNAAPAATITSPQDVTAGDICQGITVNGNTYNGTYSTGITGHEQTGIFLGGSADLPILNVAITGGTSANTGLNSAAVGSGISAQYVTGLTISGHTLNTCVGSGISLLSNVIDLSGGAGVSITNVITGDGRNVGVLVNGTGLTGHFGGFVVDGNGSSTTQAVRFDTNNGIGLAIDGFANTNSATRFANASNGLIDGVMYLTPNATTVTINAYVTEVYHADTTPIVMTQPMGGMSDRAARGPLREYVGQQRH